MKGPINLNAPCPRCGRKHRGLRVNWFKRRGTVGIHETVGWVRCKRSGSPVVLLRKIPRVGTTGSGSMTTYILTRDDDGGYTVAFEDAVAV